MKKNSLSKKKDKKIMKRKLKKNEQNKSAKMVEDQ